MTHHPRKENSLERPAKIEEQHRRLSEIPLHLVHAGFIDVQVLHEQAEFLYANAQQWWDAKWTHGTRYSLEHMPQEVLAQFKTEVFARLQEAQQPDGIREAWDLRCILGTKQAERHH